MYVSRAPTRENSGRCLVACNLSSVPNRGRKMCRLIRAQENGHRHPHHPPPPWIDPGERVLCRGRPGGGAAAATPPVRGRAEVGRGQAGDGAVVRGGARQEPEQGPAGEAHGAHQPSQHAGWVTMDGCASCRLSRAGCTVVGWSFLYLSRPWEWCAVVVVVMVMMVVE